MGESHQYLMHTKISVSNPKRGDLVVRFSLLALQRQSVFFWHQTIASLVVAKDVRIACSYPFKRFTTVSTGALLKPSCFNSKY